MEVFAFIFGTIFGSFLNVCIYRFPREESIVRPGSHCPACQMPIAWYDNIPLVSFLWLRGKCRKCGKEIPLRYFLIELLSGLIWLGFWTAWGFSGLSVSGILYFSVLLAISATDIETGYIPDKFTLPTLAAGLVLSALFPALHARTVWYGGLAASGLGVLAGGGLLLAIGLLGNFLFKKESMGGGDIKLLAMMGAFIGLKAVLVIFVGSIVAVPFSLYIRFIRKEEIICFGPFLAIAGAWLFLQGDQVVGFLFPSLI